MKCHHSFILKILVPIMGILLLSACVQSTQQAATQTPNVQWQKLQEQQGLQANQIKSLQQQIKQLQKQLVDKRIIASNSSSTVINPTISTEEPLINYTYGKDEVAGIAASAASYLAAFSHLAAGQSLAAEAGFNTFLSNFPNHQYAPNARYWLANAQLAQGKTTLAQANLQQLATNPKAKAKVPAALLQLAQIYRQQDNLLQANNVLEQLRNHYPESPEAQQFYRSTESTD